MMIKIRALVNGQEFDPPFEQVVEVDEGVETITIDFPMSMDFLLGNEDPPRGEFTKVDRRLRVV